MAVSVSVLSYISMVPSPLSCGTSLPLFAHGHLLRVLGARWIDLPPEDGSRLALTTAAISILGYERETAVLEQWNYGPSR